MENLKHASKAQRHNQVKILNIIVYTVNKYYKNSKPIDEFDIFGKQIVL